jgi:hypothetical protein
MRLVRISAFLVTLFSLASLAHAATVLTTAPYYSATSVKCDITNISNKKQLVVTIEAMNNAGDVVQTFGPNPLDPLNTSETSSLAATWCRFTIANASAKGVRAAAFYDTGSGYMLSAAAF